MIRRPKKAPTLTLEVPMPPNIANGRQHWRVKLNAKHAYYNALDMLQAAGKIPAPPSKPIARAKIDAVMHLANRMDTGNAMHRAEKWPCDWLKTRGYIVDDSPAHLEWLSFPEQHVRRDGNYRIIFSLWAA